MGEVAYRSLYPCLLQVVSKYHDLATRSSWFHIGQHIYPVDICHFIPYICLKRIRDLPVKGSMIGTGMQYVGTTWLLLQLTHKAYTIGIVLTCAAIPGILLSPFIGQLVDHMDRKWLVISADLLRVVVYSSIAVLWYLHILKQWYMYVSVFVASAGDQVYNPASLALVRELIPENDLLSANSTTSVASQLGLLIGSGLSGIIIAFLSPVSVMIINAGTFLWSASFFYNIRKCSIISVIVNERKHYKKFYFLHEVKEIFSYLKKHKEIVSLYIIMFSMMSMIRTINVLLPTFSTEVLRVGARGFGFIDASYAAGAIVGGTVLPLLLLKMNKRILMIFGPFILSVIVIFFSQSHALSIAMSCYFFMGLIFQTRLLYLTSAQRVVQNDYQGRVYTTMNIGFSILSILIYMTVGLFQEISPRIFYVMQSGILLGGGIYAIVQRHKLFAIS